MAAPGLCAALLLAAVTLPPAPAKHFNDYANLIPAADALRLDEKLRQLETSTTIQMVVAVFPELPSPSLEDFTVRTAEAWGVGQRKTDNGVVLFVFVKERRSRLEVGYGLEGLLPDAAAKQILEDVMAPPFRQGQYAAGLEAAIDRTIGVAAGTLPPVVVRRPPPPPPPPPAGVDFLGGCLKIALQWIFWVGGIALILHLLFRKKWKSSGGGTTSSSTDWTSSGSSSSSDGGFSSGGGSFGGGGASGSW